MEAGTVLLWVAVRDLSILKPGQTWSQLAAQWKTAQPSKATLGGLSKLLASVGASIVYVSSDWRIIGIRGNIGSLSGLGSVRIQSPAGDVGLIGGGVVAVGGGASSIGFYLLSPAATTGAGLGAGDILVLGGSGAAIAAGFFMAGYGIWDLATSDTSQNVPDAVDGGIPAQVGPTPDGVDSSNLPDAPVDAGTLPDNPPDIPPVCPAGPPPDGGGPSDGGGP